MGKGELNGVCNRTACNADRNVVFYNIHMQKYYCPKCARAINESGKEPICFIVEQTKIEKYVNGMIANAQRECVNQPVDGLMIMCRVEGYLSGVRETVSDARVSAPDMLSEAVYRELLEKVEAQQALYKRKIGQAVAG